MKEIKQTNELVMTAMMMCLILLATTLVRIPMPGTGGYIHMGDAMIFLAVAKLGRHKGALAAALGSSLADLLAGYAVWIPWTFVIKGGMALIFSFFISEHEKSGRKFSEVLGMVLAGLFMTAGYFAAEGIMYGNWLAAALSAPWNVLQFTVGMLVAVALQKAIAKAMPHATPRSH